MRFEALYDRLIERMRAGIRNGEFTERGMAFQTGISQPHLHNILKGVRGLRAGAADQILKRLGLSALDLFESQELVAHLRRLVSAQTASREIPVLRTRLGPGLRYPEELSPFECLPIACRDLAAVERPVVARLAEDPRMSAMVGGGDLVLLDHRVEALREPEAQALYAVEIGGEGLVRGVRCGARRLYLLAADTWDDPWRWEAIAMPPRGPEEVVRAKAIPVTREQGRGQRGF